MKVISALADIEFGVGRLDRRGDALVVFSDEKSTMATEIIVSPEDARATLGRVLFSWTAWRFFLLLPFRRTKKRAGDTDRDAWQNRRGSTGLNKPW